MTPHNGDHPLDDIAAYAVDALPPDERAPVERHLAGCRPCRDELAGHRELLADLAAAGPETPPHNVWAGIAAATSAGEPRRPTRPVTPQPQAWRRPAVLAAAALLLAVAGFVAGRWATEPRTVATMADSAVMDPRNPAARLATPGDVEVARVVVSADGAFLVAKALPSLTGGRVYQLWSLDGAAPVSLAVFDSASEVVPLALPAQVRHLALTSEPAGGAARPTSEALAEGSLSTG